MGDYLEQDDLLHTVLSNEHLRPSDLARACAVNRRFRRIARRVLWTRLRSYCGENIRPLPGHELAHALERVQQQLSPHARRLLQSWDGSLRSTGFDVAIDVHEARSCIVALIPCSKIAPRSALPVWLLFDQKLSNEVNVFPGRPDLQRHGTVPLITPGVVHLQAYYVFEQEAARAYDTKKIKLTYCGLAAGVNWDASWNPHYAHFRNVGDWKQRVANENSLQSTLERIELDFLMHEDCPHSVLYYKLHKKSAQAYVNYQKESFCLFEDYRLGDPVPRRALAALNAEIDEYVRGD